MASELMNELPQPQSVNERVARLDGSYPHLATKAHLETMQATLIKCIVGTGIALFAAMQLFGGSP